MKRFVLAIDQGTTGSTAIVFDRTGKVLGRAYSELTQHYPRFKYPGEIFYEIPETDPAFRRKIENDSGAIKRILGFYKLHGKIMFPDLLPARHHDIFDLLLILFDLTKVLRGCLPHHFAQRFRNLGIEDDLRVRDNQAVLKAPVCLDDHARTCLRPKA